MSAEDCGPKSVFKSRAENFARHLQNRLRSLSESEDGTWTSAGEVPSLSSSSENETFFEIDSNINSPEEEITEPEYIAHTNHVEDLSDSHIYCNNNHHRDSFDEQFFDTVDLNDTDSTIQSLPNEETVGCLCKPVTLPFSVPSSCSTNRSSFPGPLVNGTLEKSYLDAELSDSACDSCSTLEDNCNSPVIAVCNGCHDIKLNTENCFDGMDDHTLNLEHSTTGENPNNETGKLEEVKVTLPSNLPVSSNDEKMEDKENGSAKAMDIKDDIDEEKLSLLDLLQVINKELKLEGKQASSSTGSAESNGVSRPDISVSEVPSTSKISKPEDEEEEDIETRRMRFRRCSSLKSGKTPPSTPGRKKIVRFADVFGLDLADVKTFMDEVPTIPKSAYEDLYGVESSTPPAVDPIARISQPDRRERVVIPLFQQPGGHPNFIEKAISGTVRVKNIDFHKSVHIRYTMNNWKSFADLQARYMPNSCDGFSDKFSFLMYAHTLNVGQRLEFAVRFQARGSQYWDNNGGVNYVFQCMLQDSVTGLPPSPIDSWPTFY